MNKYLYSDNNIVVSYKSYTFVFEKSYLTA